MADKPALRATDWLSLVANVIGVSLGFAAFWVTFDPPSGSTRITLLWVIGALSVALIACAIWQVRENVIARGEAEEKERRQESRMDEMYSRLVSVVDSGSLKDRTIRLALELQNFALDREKAEKAASVNHRVGRTGLTRIYDQYKEHYGARVADIEHELNDAGVMTGTIEDYILATVVPEDMPITSKDLQKEEWRFRARNVDSIAGFLWEMAADL